MPQFALATLRNAAIYLPESAAPPACFAAEELQRYVGQMTGVLLRIEPAAEAHGTHMLVVGARPTPASPLGSGGPDSFSIRIEPARITLGGGSPRAVLSAVYALLEQFGCQWALDAAHERVPRLTTPAVDLHDVDYTTAFTVRGYCSDIMSWHYTQPEHFSEHLDEDRPFIDWMAKSGANAFFYIRHPFDTQLTIPELLPDFERRGIDLEYGGHVLPLLLPREHYRRHPEYFPQAPDGVRTDHGNLCTSSAGALATASEHTVQYVREHPEMRVLHIWGADLWRGGWCHCVECRRVSVQDQSLRVCNAVARGLAEAGMPRPVCYLAYHDTIDPALTLRPDDGVTVEFAPRERCYGHALNDHECATNRRYAAALERYLELFSGRGRLFEYYGDAILFAGCAVPLARVIAADLDYFRGLGIHEITMLQFGAFSRWAYPLNFVTFAAEISGKASEQATAAHWALSDAEAQARAAFGELEAIMRDVVTYGDIRRPPRSAERAGRVLPRIHAALPRLEGVVRMLETAPSGLSGYAPLLRYTRIALEGVREELEQTVSGAAPNAQARYAEALQHIEAADARLKGVWGRVDLPIIHAFYNVAPDTE